MPFGQHALNHFLETAQREAKVRPEGLEPPTLGSEDRCSIQLSYGRLSGILASQGDEGDRLVSRTRHCRVRFLLRAVSPLGSDGCVDPIRCCGQH